VGAYSFRLEIHLPLFFPPTIDEAPAGTGLFWRYKLPRGISVLRINSKYRTARVPSTDEIDSASEYYAGGHEYEVSEETKTALINAGIGITEDNFV
jgi:hypothetical protein